MSTNLDFLLTNTTNQNPTTFDRLTFKQTYHLSNLKAVYNSLDTLRDGRKDTATYESQLKTIKEKFQQINESLKNYSFSFCDIFNGKYLVYFLRQSMPSLITAVHQQAIISFSFDLYGQEGDSKVSEEEQRVLKVSSYQYSLPVFSQRKPK